MEEKDNLNKARWLICSDGYYPYCSRCLHESPSGQMTYYCPICGANMKDSLQEHTDKIKKWIKENPDNKLLKNSKFCSSTSDQFSDSYIINITYNKKGNIND
jgi:hypothetical protein